jgi:hypothetical protein
VSQTDSEIVYRATLNNGLEVTRRYVLAPNAGENSDPYQIRYETTFRNTGQQATSPMRVGLSLGTAAPTDDRPDQKRKADDGLLRRRRPTSSSARNSKPVAVSLGSARTARRRSSRTPARWPGLR